MTQDMAGAVEWDGPRPRACGVLIDGKRILMVRYRTSERAFWTLPGGGIERGETAEQAVVREFREETGLLVRPARLLHRTTYVPVNSGRNGNTPSAEYYFQVVMDAGESVSKVRLGTDPEEDHLPLDQQSLCGIEWILISDLRDDIQVKKVISLLALEL